MGPQTRKSTKVNLLDDFMPLYDFNEVHSVVISTTPSCIFHAIRELIPQEVQLIQTLFKIRSLPARIMGKGKTMFHGKTMFTNEPLLSQFLKYGFTMLDEAPDLGMVIGHIGQSWKLFGAKPYQFAGPEDFLSFDFPDYLKIAMNFHVFDNSVLNTKVSTETRIIAITPQHAKSLPSIGVLSIQVVHLFAGCG